MPRARRCLLVLLAALAPATPAAAAPLGELPFQRVPDGAACLAATGAPGELSRRDRGGVSILVAGAPGLGRPVPVPLGELPGCPRAAADASGAAVVAGATEDALRVALREPGGAPFGAPVTLAAARNVYDLSVAVSPHGDAIVAWAEWSYVGPRTRVRVVRRDAGGPFGAPVDLVPWRLNRGSATARVAMGPDGESAVLVRHPRGSSRDNASADGLRTGARGAPLGPPAPLPNGVSAEALGVGPDGRIVLAASSGGSVQVLERPRGAGLGAPQPLAELVIADQLALAFGADGSAVVAWRDSGDKTTGAALRGPGTGFGPPVVIVPPPKQPTGPGFGAGFPIVGPLPDFQAAVGPDGRVSVAWEDGGAHLATIAGNAVVERDRLGARLRDPQALSLLALPDGRRALAWLNQDRFDARAPARVHLAVEGVPPARERATPRVTIGQPRERALRPGQSLTLPVRCSAACDLRVRVGRSSVERSLARAGTVTVELRPADGAIAPVRPGPVRVVVEASAPGARALRRTVATPRLRRLPALPLPRIETVRTRRLSGGRVEVRWRLSSDARETLLGVTATTSRSEDDYVASDALWGDRRRAYRVVLEDADTARWIHVEVLGWLSERRRVVTVRLR